MNTSIEFQLAVHEALMGRLPVRTVLCADAGEDQEHPEVAPEKGKARPIKRNGRRPWLPRPAGYISKNQLAEIGERRILADMRAGEWYSAKYLASLGGLSEKSFYTHVRRMVERKQLIRKGRRHHFCYRKAERHER